MECGTEAVGHYWVTSVGLEWVKGCVAVEAIGREAVGLGLGMTEPFGIHLAVFDGCLLRGLGDFVAFCECRVPPPLAVCWVVLMSLKGAWWLVSRSFAYTV